MLGLWHPEPRVTRASRAGVVLLIGAAMLSPVVLPASAAAGKRTLRPVADSYVSQATPSKNHGKAQLLRIDGSPSVRTYLRFKVKLPRGRAIKRATLKLYSRASSRAAGYRAYAVSNRRWRERTITRRNAPSFRSMLGRSHRRSRSRYVSVRLPGSSIHRGMISLGAATRSKRARTFSSREATHKPRLVVRYSRTAQGPMNPPATPLVPANGVLLGAYHRDPPTASWSTSEFARFESVVGRRLAIDHRFNDWGSESWPAGFDTWDVNNGRIPMESLGGASFPGLDALNSGSQDPYLTRLADRVKAFGARLFIRPLWEMNGEWMTWSGAKANDAGQTNGPEKYVRAWRRMHDIFVRRGATNAVWVWAPNCEDVPRTGWNHWTNYYPGDAYVDWAACDWYNWGTSRTWSHWTSWANGFGQTPSVYGDYPSKPFMVAETGSCEQGGDKRAWFADAQRDVKASFPNLKAFLYFDVYKEQAYKCDWRVNSSPGALDGFRALAADPYFNGSVASASPSPTMPAGGGDPVVMAAGDFQGGSGAGGNAGAVASLMSQQNPSVILGLGDFQYDYGSQSALLAGFDRNFGPRPNGLWPRIRPTAGPTHDVNSASDTRGGYWSYWGREPFRGYSFDLGNWHIVQLPSPAYRYGVDTSGLLTWLNADLNANTRRCTLAFWHEPYWTRQTGAHTRTTSVRPWVQALYDHNAELILSGHQHDYQRFAPQTPSDQLDSARGVRGFVVGTGGNGHYTFIANAANLEVSDDTSYGALKLTLHPGSYDWRFLATNSSFTDSGSAACH